MSNLSVADVLERAADKLSKPGVWAQGGTAPGRAIGLHCAATAITDAGGTWRGVEQALADHLNLEGLLPYSIHHWNDAPGRTQAEVVSALRQAAEKARQP